MPGNVVSLFLSPENPVAVYDDFYILTIDLVML